MITIKQFLETIKYRITSSDPYSGQYFPTGSMYMDFWNEEHDGHSLSMLFNPSTQEVYEVSVSDYSANRSYRLLNPDTNPLTHTITSSEERDLFNDAWDGTKHTDLSTVEDWISKAAAIVAGLPYDTGISVPLQLDKEVMFALMMEAHRSNITLNQLLNEVLEAAMVKLESAHQSDDQ